MRLLGITLASAAIFVLQLALLRLFAVQQFYHFAFMAVSLALLGFGASGTLLSLRGRPFAPWRVCAAFGAGAVAAYLVIDHLPFDSFSIAWDPRQPLFLALYFLAAAVPFLFGGLLIGGELMRAGETGASHRVYGANLIGSAFGALASLPLLMRFGGVGTVVLAATLGAAAGLCFLRPPWRASNRAAAGLTTVLVAAGVLTLLAPPPLFEQRLSPYKTLPQLVGALGSEHVLQAWDRSARIDVVESGAIHMLPGLSLASPVGPPPQVGLLLDGGTLLPISGLAPDAPEAELLADHMPVGGVFRLRPGAETLVLAAGTGMDVLFALSAGAARVTAVEERALVVEIVRDRYREFTGGLYRDPRVTVVVEASRVHARAREPGRFGVVIVSLNDPHRPVTSGAYSLGENHLYTVEAIGDYLRALDEGGLLFVTRWLQTPPSESARLFGTMAAALARSGRDPSTHLVAFRSLRTMSVIAGERPFGAGEIATLRAFLQERGFDAVHLPGMIAADANRFNVLPEPVYAELFARLLAEPERVYRDYPFDIRPTSDDRPFFFHHFRWRQTPEILAGLGRSWQPFGGSGFFVLVALLALMSAAAALFIVAPLLFWRRAPAGRPGGPSRWRVFAFFACLGLGFLFVEVALAQRFILVFGQPVVALAVILLALLSFSGLGSLTVERWTLRRALPALVLLLALLPLLLAPFSNAVLPLPEWGRLGLTVLLLATPGYLMGVPFAAGLRRVEIGDAALVPWAWAINGSFSVIAAVLAVLVALGWGFSAVLWLGAACYAGALLAFWDQGA